MGGTPLVIENWKKELETNPQDTIAILITALCCIQTEDGLGLTSSPSSGTASNLVKTEEKGNEEERENLLS